MIVATQFQCYIFPRRFDRTVNIHCSYYFIGFRTFWRCHFGDKDKIQAKLKIKYLILCQTKAKFTTVKIVY